MNTLLLKYRYFIFISYKGSAYHGWQIQPGSVTVQEIMEKALSTILSEEIRLTGAGRTDTGVHASFFCAHFDSIRDNLGNSPSLLHKLNRFLPLSIAVNSVKMVVPDANARFSALSRTYKYYVTRVKDPFMDDYHWYLYGDINLKVMNEACTILRSFTDFTSFSKLHSGSKTNICNIYEAHWAEKDNILIFTIKADRFLRNMVRAIVGTMVEMGFSKLGIEEFRDIIAAKDRCRAGMSAPAKGLFLHDIEYPEEIYTGGKS